MFDRTTVLAGRTSTAYVPYEKTVHEHRAPTDESVKIYDEMREAAHKAVIDTIKINDNSINMVATMSYLPWDMSYRADYKLTVNGEKLSGHIDYEVKPSRHEVFSKVMDVLSRHIASELLKQLAPALVKI